jgi:hypothetical protein
MCAWPTLHRHRLATPADLWQSVDHGKQRQRKSRKKEAQEGSAAKGLSAYGYYDKQARRSQNLTGASISNQRDQSPPRPLRQN